MREGSEGREGGRGREEQKVEGGKEEREGGEGRRGRREEGGRREGGREGEEKEERAKIKGNIAI